MQKFIKIWNIYNNSNSIENNGKRHIIKINKKNLKNSSNGLYYKINKMISKLKPSPLLILDNNYILSIELFIILQNSKLRNYLNFYMKNIIRYLAILINSVDNNIQFFSLINILSILYYYQSIKNTKCKIYDNKFIINGLIKCIKKL